MTAADRARKFSEDMRAQEEDDVYKPKFVWPCYKRKAHGPHPVGCMDHPSDQPDIKPFKVCPNCIQCSGLPAHPSTQIGGNYAAQDIPA